MLSGPDSSLPLSADSQGGSSPAIAHRCQASRGPVSRGQVSRGPGSRGDGSGALLRRGGAPLLALLALGLGGMPAFAEGSAAGAACAAPQPGRYVVLGDGEAMKEPVARILQETWRPDGSLEGLRLERRGSIYREVAYTGRYRPLNLCRVAIERGYLDGKTLRTSTSQAVLDRSGRPRYSLGTLPDVVVASRWFNQGNGPCNAAMLDGTLVGIEAGRSYRDGRWLPNAVIQNETWKGGALDGIAISSYGPRIEEATYSGTITVEPSCLATIKEKDSLGVPYSYRAVVLADGRGYLYIQTDPNNLSVGYMEHQAGSGATAGHRH
jgi:hypothetical protein